MFLRLLRLRPAFLLLLPCVLMPGAARAQEATPTPDDNPITMEVAAPLALSGLTTSTQQRPVQVQARFGHWFALAATLGNAGEAVKGTLRLTLAGNGGLDKPTSQFVTDVDLPASAARKRVWIYGRFEREEVDGGVLEFSGQGIQTLRRRFDLVRIDDDKRLVLSISDSGAKLSSLSGLIDPRLSPSGAAAAQQNRNRNGAQGFVRTTSATHELVPSRWIGFDGVDAVVLQDFAHTALSPDQIEAVKGYVAGGGTLIVPAGANWQRLSSSPLSELWPLNPQSSGAASRTEVGDLVNRYVIEQASSVSKIPGGGVIVNRMIALTGADRLGGAPVVVTRGSLKPDARVSDGTSKAPLLSSLDYGAGRTLFLSYDPTQPPFIGWSGNPELWVDVFGQSPRPNGIEGVTGGFYNNYNYNRQPYYGSYDDSAPDTPTGQLMRNLARTPQLRTPPVWSIAWFLALYVFFLVPVNYVVLRFFDKRELAWLTVPLIVGVFSALSYSTALSIKGRDVLTRQIDIVQGTANSPLARADSMLWLFSPRKTSYQLGAQSPMILASRITPADEGGSGITIQEGDAGRAFQVPDAAVNMWDNRTFVGQTVLPLGKGLSLGRDERGQLQLMNNTPNALRGATLVVGGRVYKCGDIAANGSAGVGTSDGLNLVDPTLAGRIVRASGLSSIFPTTSEGQPGAVAQQALSVALGANFGKSVPPSMLIAWSDQAATDLKVEAETPRAQKVTLWMFRLPAKLPGSLPGSRLTAGLRGWDEPSFELSVAPVRSVVGSGRERKRATTYDCHLPDALDRASRKSVFLTLKLSLGEVGEVGLSSKRAKQSQEGVFSHEGMSVFPEPWDFRTERWDNRAFENIRLVSDPKGMKTTILIVSLSDSELARFVRRPDNLLRLRVLTDKPLSLGDLIVSETPVAAR